jgi:hypothetical protein
MRNPNRVANKLFRARIHLKYPELEEMLKLSPKQRIEYIENEYKRKFNLLIGTGLIGEFEIIGSEKRVTGVTAKISKDILFEIEKFPYVDLVSVEKKDSVKRKPSFYCVKMTVAIEIENAERGFQSYEQRFVLIKAESVEKAYEKIEQIKDDYSKPYLNSDGYLVRWRIESLDDCYETGISSLKEFDNPEGVEVFSTLKRRKLTKDRIWDGKT